MKLPIGSAVTGTYLPALIGGVLGAIGSVAFLLHTKAFSNEQATNRGSIVDRRRLSIRIVVSLYLVIAFGGLIVAISIGDPTFIVLTAIIAFIAAGALARLWSGR